MRPRFQRPGILQICSIYNISMFTPMLHSVFIDIYMSVCRFSRLQASMLCYVYIPYPCSIESMQSVCFLWIKVLHFRMDSLFQLLYAKQALQNIVLLIIIIFKSEVSILTNITFFQYLYSSQLVKHPDQLSQIHSFRVTLMQTKVLIQEMTAIIVFNCQIKGEC